MSLSRGIFLSNNSVTENFWIRFQNLCGSNWVHQGRVFRNYKESIQNIVNSDREFKFMIFVKGAPVYWKKN